MREHTSRLLADDFVFLEAPRWHESRLWVTDVFDSIVYSLDLLGNRTIVLSGLPPRPSSINFLPDGTLIVVASVKRQLLRLVSGRLELHADLSTLSAGDLSDFMVDGSGRIYVSNFGYDLFAGAPLQPTCLHTVGTDSNFQMAW
jgi:sugar lactone lactonase YvrE